MSGTLEKLLVRYPEYEHVVRLKARFLLRVCITGIFVLPIVIIYNVYLSLTKEVYAHAIYWPIIAPIVIIFIMYCAVALLITRGRYTIAAHCFFIASQGLIWAIMWVDKSGPVARLDTIMVLIAILSMSPLVISRRPLLIPVYSAITVLIAYIFIRLNMPVMNLALPDLTDFLGDTAIAAVVVAIMTYNLFSINRAALDRLGESNAMLERTNEELTATNEELGAAMEELTATNEEFEAQNRELRESQAIISESLEEKNVLIKEIHHRVKNNMQVISSLLGLQANTIEDDVAKQHINDAISRIHSMALIHEKIYSTDNFSRIDMSTYVRDLLHDIIQLYSISPNDIQVKSDLETVYLSIGQAVPCGILINEILTNSIKHGHRGTGSYSIEMAMSASDDMATLVIADSGPGLDNGLLDQNSAKTMGIQLIKALVQQLNADIAVISDNGTRFTIRFRIHD